jgi:SAM-dependent methyltransferase
MKNIQEAFIEVKESFPFKGYMDCKLIKYIAISDIILTEVPKGSRILDIGCGPCDLTAILSKLGYSMTGIDDLRDPWHLIGRNRDRIKAFAKEMDIQLINEPIESARLEENAFDAVLLIDVIEHSLNPRTLLNRAISALKANGLLLIETPNSVALVKRVLSLMGKSSYPSVGFIYFNVGMYRGHVREYTVSELEYMLKQNGIMSVKVKMANSATKSLICESRGFRKTLLKLYDLTSDILPNLRDTIIIFGRKPENWKPLDDLIAFRNLKNYYKHLVEYNLDNEDDDSIASRIGSEGCI